MAWEGHKKDKKDIVEGCGVTRTGPGVAVRACYFIGESLLCPVLHFTITKHTMVLLVTSDNEQFVVEKDVAERSVLIKNMLEGDSFPFYLTPESPPIHDFLYTDVGESDQPIPLPNVSSSVLKKACIFACEDAVVFIIVSLTGP